MEDMKITFLGTGSAVPSPTRNHTAILAQFLNESVLVDCGEATQIQFRKVGISLHKLTKILITHWHGDHILGIPGLFQTLALSNYSKTLDIYGPKGTVEFMSKIHFILGHYKINHRIHEISSGKVTETKDYLIEAKEMHHGIPSLAYSIILKDKIRLDKKKLKKLKIPNSPLLGQLQSGKDISFSGKKIKSSQVTYKEKGKKVTFILDTLFNQSAITLANNSDLLVTESSFLENSDKGKELAISHKHLTANQAGLIAKKAKAKKLILTHISERYEHNHIPLLKEAKKAFKNTSIAADLQVVNV